MVNIIIDHWQGNYNGQHGNNTEGNSGIGNKFVGLDTAVRLHHAENWKISWDYNHTILRNAEKCVSADYWAVGRQFIYLVEIRPTITPGIPTCSRRNLMCAERRRIGSTSGNFSRISEIFVESRPSWPAARRLFPFHGNHRVFWIGKFMKCYFFARMVFLWTILLTRKGNFLSTKLTICDSALTLFPILGKKKKKRQSIFRRKPLLSCGWEIRLSTMIFISLCKNMIFDEFLEVFTEK